MEADLRARWAVLATEFAESSDGIEAVSSGVAIQGRDVLIGLDGARRRHVLVPVAAGEAFAEDRRGRAVHLVAIRHRGHQYLAAVCLQRELDEVFARFAGDLVSAVATSTEPARLAVATLDSWRRLLAETGQHGVLGESAIIGLRAEIATVLEVLERDPAKRVSIWSGPSGHQHDLRWSGGAIEVKATLAREGRIVGISSVDQLSEPPEGTLHLVHHRFERDPDGESLDQLVDTLRAAVSDSITVDALLREAGYSDEHREEYRVRRHRLVDRRIYDVTGPGFPRITSESFASGRMPPGTLRLTYAIDLTNTPPHPLSPDEEVALWTRAGAA